MSKNDLPRTCVHPSGRFVYGIHRPAYKVKNVRMTRERIVLGHTRDNTPIDNSVNFPSGDLEIERAQWIYEVPNPFPCWGTTYILKDSADRFSGHPEGYRFKTGYPEGTPQLPSLFSDLAAGKLRREDGGTCSLSDLPRTIQLALAQTSSEPGVLKALAALACELEYDKEGNACGIRFAKDDQGRLRPVIRDHDLFEVLGNNPSLPYDHKLGMVLNPGVQGTSPIVGEYSSAPGTHVWEYLRANSYIPWGHFASNMAHDAVRYSAKDLSLKDMMGLRHLYYQRTCIQMALSLGMEERLPHGNAPSMSPGDLEELRLRIQDVICRHVKDGIPLPYNSTLWGWNYGFDFSPTGYRLHASHQQIHQQFALITPDVEANEGGTLPTYAIGDQIAWFTKAYYKTHGSPFFKAYLKALKSNTRMDGKDDLPRDLILWEHQGVLIVVPKAQRSQGEVQIMVEKPVGNVMEADQTVRAALDLCIFLVIRSFHRLGAEMVTCCEISKRFDNEDTDQRLFYCFLPRHPQSPGAFSERQERWITGHYPEDFGAAFRQALAAEQSELEKE